MDSSISTKIFSVMLKNLNYTHKIPKLLTGFYYIYNPLSLSNEKVNEHIPLHKLLLITIDSRAPSFG